MVHTALAGKTNASKANAASALQRLLSAAKESLQTMRVILIWSGRRRLQLHSTWPRQCAGSCGGRWAWEQRVRPTAGGGERASIGARMMREQLTGVARAEERKSWMLKRRAAEAAAAAATADFTARTCRVAGGGSSCTHECVMTSDTVNAAFSIAERKQQQRWSEGALLSQTQHPHGILGKGSCSGIGQPLAREREGIYKQAAGTLISVRLVSCKQHFGSVTLYPQFKQQSSIKNPHS